MNILLLLGALSSILILIVLILYFELQSLRKRLLAKESQIQETLQRANSTFSEAMAMREEAQRMKEDLERRIDEARRESVQKSKEVVAGKVTEQLAPFFPNFKYNPRDVRFIGTPIDLVVFNGLDSGKVESIVFMEIKTGNSRMTEREKSVKEAIDASRVSFEILRIDSTLDQVE
ncbi:Holliday junction resolvase-like protein [Thermoplasma sp.]|uniref:Holliday junction resolvase-like protein n=1 Tax=Thermoplasma sp. TaxID=1973142 RepID=UPI00261E8119|nr:Holliday junction resolvase-like protein [Thermoplasma sp.]